MSRLVALPIALVALAARGRGPDEPQRPQALGLEANEVGDWSAERLERERPFMALSPVHRS